MTSKQPHKIVQILLVHPVILVQFNEFFIPEVSCIIALKLVSCAGNANIEPMDQIFRGFKFGPAIFLKFVGDPFSVSPGIMSFQSTTRR